MRLYSGVDLNANYTNYSLNSNNVLMDYSYKIGSKIAPEYTAYSKLYNNQGYSNISYGRTNTNVGTYMYWVRNNINKNEAITANKTMITSNSLDNGYIIQDNGCGVRPVLWVDLTYKPKRNNNNGWDGDYYYVDGEKVINDWVQYNNKWYYLDTDGKYVRGDWKQVGNDWYYFNTDGDMAENTWVNNEYYVDGDGKMLKDTITPDGYYVDGNGKYISNNNSIESLLKLYDKINSETGAFKNVDGSYYTMGVYPSYEKPQLSALFDQYGNLWYLEEEFVGAGKVGTRYYLQIKYLNGSDSEVFTRQFYYDDRDGGSSGYEYDSTQAENMFKQYDNLKDHYTQIKNNVSITGSNKSVILDADLVKLYNDIKAQIPNGLFENFGSNVIYKGKSLSDYQFGVVHAAKVKFNTDGNLWVYTFYGGIGRDNITIRIFSADGNMKMYYCTTKRDGSLEPFCTTNNSKEITFEEYSRIEKQFDNMVDMYDVYMKNGNVTNASNNNDSLSNQIKRAKLVSEYNSNTTVDKMDTVTFGSYYQSNSNTIEPIEWIVLDRQGNKTLLLSKYILDCKCYNDEHKNITYENCTLRYWLNNTFYNTAFSSNEKSFIDNTYVINNDNAHYNTSGGNNTYDNVFLLSIDEVNKYFYQSDMYTSNKRLATKGTNYAKNVDNNGYNLWVRNSSGEWYSGNSNFWLRSPGLSQLSAADVGNYGYLNGRGGSVDFHPNGVRPAIWVEY